MSELDKINRMRAEAARIVASLGDEWSRDDKELILSWASRELRTPCPDCGGKSEYDEEHDTCLDCGRNFQNGGE